MTDWGLGLLGSLGGVANHKVKGAGSDLSESTIAIKRDGYADCRILTSEAKPAL